VSLFSDFRSEAVRLFSPTVCPLGLFNGSAPQTEEEAKQLSDAVSSKCDGCGACVDMADEMLSVDIEDIAKANSQERAERAATGSPLRGCLTLKPTMGKTVLMVSTGNSGAETGKEALQRAASEARYAWQNADF
jgi:ferredoxin